MSRWLKKGSCTPETLGLPDPFLCNTTEEAVVTRAANDAVDQDNQTPVSRKRKRGEYSIFDGEQRAKIARLAIEIEPTRAAIRMSSELGRKLNESTVRSIKTAYLKKSKQGETVASLDKAKRGAPLILGEKLNGHVQDWIRKVLVSGGVINCRTVMAGIEGIVTKMDKSKFGGHLDITLTSAQSVLSRMGFVKRKGTKDAKKLPEDFDTIKTGFTTRVADCIQEHDIPSEMVVNWNQTGVNLIPGGDLQLTMAEKGVKQVTITGIDDKRQIASLLTASMSGDFLPPQLLYAGKTNRCHPTGGLGRTPHREPLE